MMLFAEIIFLIFVTIILNIIIYECVRSRLERITSANCFFITLILISSPNTLHAAVAFPKYGHNNFFRSFAWSCVDSRMGSIIIYFEREFKIA